jgi:cell division septal protein FtsQ
MKILIWVIVALVIVGGLTWFLSPNKSNVEKITNVGSNNQQQQNTQQVTETGSITSDDEVFNEIDNALAGLE